MIRIEDAQPRDGTCWRRGPSISWRRSSAIHPQPGVLYYGRGLDTVAGYRWVEPADKAGVICLPERWLVPVDA